ncbi:50S ribosomal protein L5 [Candidatus Saccharibacteria bacterium RIFCSPHIGHO2_12_FULL_49_19]|nr:MAG: 50S ribosomal protein L5 [Candidatus Saccharibacteria bacterium RIFCSPHIGHO2_01_FULL_49_21]OGL37788.1 MAG: 50S ribosomal protein L5 [Candidatus Saccharibacteria bacterium RIFCSPHIGHO2_12_FULL_49_19]OGL38579.1 MAG: 50S ribosomal protein L5 [Candidatus Saccharibacteria bacterium RIFCSPLOWO2_01_FULL_49_22]
MNPLVKSTPKSYAPRLDQLYREKVAVELKDEFGLKNINQVPKLERVVLNVGLGRAQGDKKVLEAATNTLRKVTGQQPIITTAKKSIASFKLRAGSQIGLQVTLRGARMYEFADRLINLVLPRLRDFRGVKAAAFDGQGNYSIGFSDQSVFPELSFEETTTPHGLQVTFVIRAANKEQARSLLARLGMPFEKEEVR